MCLVSVVSTCISTRLSGFSVSPSLDVEIRPAVVGGGPLRPNDGSMNIRYDLEFWPVGVRRVEVGGLTGCYPLVLLFLFTAPGMGTRDMSMIVHSGNGRHRRDVRLPGDVACPLSDLLGS